MALGFSPFVTSNGGSLLATGADDQRVRSELRKRVQIDGPMF